MSPEPTDDVEYLENDAMEDEEREDEDDEGETENKPRRSKRRQSSKKLKVIPSPTATLERNVSEEEALKRSLEKELDEAIEHPKTHKRSNSADMGDKHRKGILSVSDLSFFFSLSTTLLIRNSLAS